MLVLVYRKAPMNVFNGTNLIDLSEEFLTCQNLVIRSQGLQERVCTGFQGKNYKEVAKSLRALFRHVGHLKIQDPICGPRQSRGQKNAYIGALAFWDHAVKRLSAEQPDAGVRVAINALEHIGENRLLYSDLKASVFGAIVNVAAEAVEREVGLFTEVAATLERVIMNTASHLDYPEMEELFRKAGGTWLALVAKALPALREERIGVFEKLKNVSGQIIGELEDLLNSAKTYGHPPLAGKTQERKFHLRLVVSNVNP